MAHTDDKFLPRTTMLFCSTGIDDYYKPFFTSNAAMAAWMRTKVMAGTQSITDYSFQRDIEGFPIRVDHNDAEYSALLQCDTVCWSNHQSNYNVRWMVGHITAVEWKNPNCSFVYYEIDWFTSYVDCINWDKSICFIEREHVEKDWDGNNPIFNNCGVPEGMGLNADYRIESTEWQMFSNTDLDYVVVAPYDKGLNISIQSASGMRRYNGLTFNVFQSKSEVSTFLTSIAKDFRTQSGTSGSLALANINNVVAIYTIPRATKGDTTTHSVTPPWITKPTFRNAKCWHSDFNTFRLYVPMANKPIDFAPEYIGSSYANFTLEREVDATGDVMFMRVTPLSQRYTEGRIPNIDMSAIISQAPQGAWVGDQFAQWNAISGLGLLGDWIFSSIGTVFNAYSRNSINNFNAAMSQGKSGGEQIAHNAIVSNANNVVSAVSDVARGAINVVTSYANAQLNGAALGGTGNLGQNTTFEHFGFMAYVYFYQCSPMTMQSIDQYFDRYGYKVNAMRAPNPKNRNRWYYVRCAEAHVEDNGGINTIGSIGRRSIEAILNAGVTIFRTDNGVNIGDFSNPELNKAT